MKHWLLATGIVILFGMTMASISCTTGEGPSNRLEKVPSDETPSTPTKSGPPLPDLSIDNVEMLYSYQYAGEQPVTFSAPFSGKVRVDTRWVPVDPFPEKYGTYLVFTLSNKGNVDSKSPEEGERSIEIDVYVDDEKWYCPIRVPLPGGCLEAGESFKYWFDNTGEGSGFIFDVAGCSEKFLFDLYYKGDEIDKDNNKYETTVTYYDEG